MLFTEFYTTTWDDPYTCSPRSITYHGILYKYRKSLIRRIIKRKVLIHLTKRVPYGDAEALAEAKKCVESSINFCKNLYEKSGSNTGSVPANS